MASSPRHLTCEYSMVHKITQLSICCGIPWLYIWAYADAKISPSSSDNLAFLFLFVGTLYAGICILKRIRGHVFYFVYLSAWLACVVTRRLTLPQVMKVMMRLRVSSSLDCISVTCALAPLTAKRFAARLEIFWINIMGNEEFFWTFGFVLLIIIPSVGIICGIASITLQAIEKRNGINRSPICQGRAIAVTLVNSSWVLCHLTIMNYAIWSGFFQL